MNKDLAFDLYAKRLKLLGLTRLGQPGTSLAEKDKEHFMKISIEYCNS